MLQSGCEPPKTGIFSNTGARDVQGRVEQECGPYLARTMSNLGYRTFGIGKFHTVPWNEDLGYETHLYAEELYGTRARREGDGYASFMDSQHPEYAHVEALKGERSEMYYMPQTSSLPANLNTESWVTDQAVEQINQGDGRPFFGLVSFTGPHPPYAPPVPFSRAFDPARMPEPVLGDLAVDHADDRIPWNNYAVWAEEVDTLRAKSLKARYYGMIAYIDSCIGRLVDAVEARSDASNTMICFVSDHGEFLGDHHAWQKEAFFEAACHIPFLVSWPRELPAGTTDHSLVALSDLFGIATGAAGSPEQRDGTDVLGTVRGNAAGREYLVGYCGEPGTSVFRAMVRNEEWKYIYIANGGRQQLFDVRHDPDELDDLAGSRSSVLDKLRSHLVESITGAGLHEAMAGSELRSFEYAPQPRKRIIQFEKSLGIAGFPAHPADLLSGLECEHAVDQ